jgi:hypothetical protein
MRARTLRWTVLRPSCPAIVRCEARVSMTRVRGGVRDIESGPVWRWVFSPTALGNYTHAAAELGKASVLMLLAAKVFQVPVG